MKNILVLQHEPHEGIGAWEPIFNTAGRKLVTRNLFAGEKVPLEEELCEWDGIVIMGGPMSANDGESLDFIRDELKMIPQILQLKIPLLGVCLGSQVIAKGLGSKVYKGAKKEIGWYPLKLTASAEKDKIFGGLGSSIMMFQWHGETFDLPSGAIHLSNSPLYPHQAFRYTDRIYGLQFHCEMTDSMIREWVEKGQEELARAEISGEKILEDTPKYLSTLRQWAHHIAKKWLALK
jgi:GMP synthase (glutamine-hydrolysing)